MICALFFTLEFRYNISMFTHKMAYPDKCWCVYLYAHPAIVDGLTCVCFFMSWIYNYGVFSVLDGDMFGAGRYANGWKAIKRYIGRREVNRFIRHLDKKNAIISVLHAFICVHALNTWVFPSEALCIPRLISNVSYMCAFTLIFYVL